MHRLSRSAVVRHQRVRIHGAMIEAVAQHGYGATSVRLVVGLAGVSRRCFYEQFTNKAVQGRQKAGVKMDREQLLKLAGGRVWTGRQAKECGLVGRRRGLQSLLLQLCEDESVDRGSGFGVRSSGFG